MVGLGGENTNSHPETIDFEIAKLQKNWIKQEIYSRKWQTICGLSSCLALDFMMLQKVFVSEEKSSTIKII